MKTRTILEGCTRALVPMVPDDQPLSISSASVFYNKEMELNRDLSVASIAAYSEIIASRKHLDLLDITYVDALSASGIRGLRIAKEIGLNVTLNDWSEEAYTLIRENTELNELTGKVRICLGNANVLLHKERYNIVDIDPFGSPTTYLDAASSSAINMLAVTATDTAPLCGAHLNSGIRKYGAVPLNIEYHSEMGLRILLGRIAIDLARHEKAMQPMFCHATRHYVRAYLEVKKSANSTDKCLKNMGFIAHCTKCTSRSVHYGLAVHIPEKCEICGNYTNIAGPLWLGPLHDKDFCDSILIQLSKRELGKKEHAAKIVELCKNELDIPTFYDQHLLSKQMRISAIPMEELLKELVSNGFKASRTHFSGTSFKTNAGLEGILDTLRRFR
ncbi:tRNA (guanine(10)-N(2))-dimethyltransferase [Methanomethylovorans sp.]|uniref:tRNA (guanine(10)-N(2))-dimethyltransferase n=1 Tax=Methanomethylovorans sp. TaxID=2758717 RepID=UPI00351C914C